jgi:hypothetical protein
MISLPILTRVVLSLRWTDLPVSVRAALAEDNGFRNVHPSGEFRVGRNWSDATEIAVDSALFALLGAGKYTVADEDWFVLRDYGFSEEQIEDALSLFSDPQDAIAAHERNARLD